VGPARKRGPRRLGELPAPQGVLGVDQPEGRIVGLDTLGGVIALTGDLLECLIREHVLRTTRLAGH
jgi:hypothetical protein